MLDDGEYFECSCGTVSHVFRLVKDKQENVIYLDINLNHYKSWYKRILPALRYLVGRERYGAHYSEFILEEKDIIRLIKVCYGVLYEDFLKTDDK
tara:strand:+ start:885 stop:1169 length:285 start_codon:yes stop_codon:yes gene_type:complete